MIRAVIASPIRIAAVAGILLAPGTASGQESSNAPFAPLGLERMAALATQIVAGTVESVDSAWNHDRSRIQTRVTLRVERRIAGPAGSTVVFRIPGGTVGPTTILVTDMPTFEPGEHVLVFLRGTRGRLPSVLGGPEGKLGLTRSAERGELALQLPLPLPAAANADPTPTRDLAVVENFVRARIPN